MPYPTNLIPKRSNKMLSRQEAIAFREQAHMLAIQIGLNPAARALQIKPTRIRKWASRHGWDLSANGFRKRGYNANDHDLTLSADSSQSHGVTSPINAMNEIMSKMADRTRLAMARTGLRAFEHADTVKDAELHELPRSVALEKHAKVAAIAHNWTNQPVSVGVAVSVPLPSESERQEMRSMDAKLDAIAAKLKA